TQRNYRSQTMSTQNVDHQLNMGLVPVASENEASAQKADVVTYTNEASVGADALFVTPHSPLSFPETGYVGAAAHWADVMSRHYESPKKFFYIDLLTLLGTALSGRVRVNFGGLVTQPRLYTLKIAKSGWRRKSTSTSFAEKFLTSVLKEADQG